MGSDAQRRRWPNHAAAAGAGSDAPRAQLRRRRPPASEGQEVRGGSIAVPRTADATADNGSGGGGDGEGGALESDGVIVVGIAGGSASGKSTIVEALMEALGGDAVALSHDWYYHDIAHLPLEERAATNFDHPESLETELLLAHIAELRASRAVEAPQYDFVGHRRVPGGGRRIAPARVVIVDGILLLSDPRIRALCDIALYVDSPPDVRLARRLLRDVRDRGRSVEGVVEQYMRTVRPMHDLFVEPSKQHADVVVPSDRDTTVAVDVVVAAVAALGGVGHQRAAC